MDIAGGGGCFYAVSVFRPFFWNKKCYCADSSSQICAKDNQFTICDFTIAIASAVTFKKPFSLCFQESITDTVRMLAGYTTKQSVFIIRSPQEGTCAWLRTTLHDFAQKIGIPMPALINAGDGQHSHPTHEYFDQFSFLEQCKWNREHIHIALVGDLFHGRLAHSKADGLKIFRNVKVDLVAPPELQMPSHVVQQMKRQGFQVRVSGAGLGQSSRPPESPRFR